MSIHTVPTAPPCFTRSTWVLYLASEQNGKTKPFNADGSYRKSFNFCKDCDLQKAVQMHVDGSCKPSFHRSLKETKHVETV